MNEITDMRKMFVETDEEKILKLIADNLQFIKQHKILDVTAEGVFDSLGYNISYICDHKEDSDFKWRVVDSFDWIIMTLTAKEFKRKQRYGL